MSSQINLQLSNRSRKKTLKLPSEISVTNNATIEDVKKAVARTCGIKDFNRIGLFNADTKKRFADRLARVDAQDTTAFSVQDLGPQAAWRTVYLVEYLGPLLFHPLLIYLRPHLAGKIPYFYDAADKIPITTTQWIVFAMFMSHFIKRELETAFLHRFAASTMPQWFIARNSLFYWSAAGLLCAASIYSPRSLAARPSVGFLDILGIAIFLGGETLNYIVHVHLAGLRKPGGTEKGIPSCVGSSLVTCPNYMFEVLSWVGVGLIARDWSLVVFLGIGMTYMRIWATGKEKALRSIFGDKYKKKRYLYLPGLI